MPSLLLSTYSLIPCPSPQDRIIQVNEWTLLQEGRVSMPQKTGSLAPPPFLHAFQSHGVEISRPRKVLFAWVKPSMSFLFSISCPQETHLRGKGKMELLHRPDLFPTLYIHMSVPESPSPKDKIEDKREE